MMEWFRGMAMYSSIIYGLFNLLCADMPFRSTDETKQRCATVACACFLLALCFALCK